MRANSLSHEQSQIDSLRDLSARIGRDPLLFQASSGNTSIKIGDVMWIKASGKWLSHAQAQDFLLPVNLTRARRCLKENIPIPETQKHAFGRGSASIETAMHAVLPQTVVVHVHSVNTIAWAVREDAPRQLGERLTGFRWRWIPYTPSGPALARRIEHALRSLPETEVLVLGNHGLVVCGDSCYSAEHLLQEVERQLAIEPRSAPAPHLAFLQRAVSRSGCCLPLSTEVHALATDHVSRSILAGGILYPCQAIFLSSSVFHLYKDYGVLCSADITAAEQEVLAGFANVVRRIDPVAPLRHLTAAEITAVLSDEAENYRQVAVAEGAVLTT